MTWFAMIGKWFIGTKFGRWLVGIFAVLVALAAALAVAFEKGKHSQAAKDQAKDARAAQRAAQAETDAVQHAAQVRQDVDNAIAKIPEAPAQSVATAAPDSAAGKLRDDWSRD